MNPDAQELARQFNEDEAVHRCYQQKPRARKRQFRLRSRFGEKLLDQLDYIAAEREARPVHAIGAWIDW